MEGKGICMYAAHRRLPCVHSASESNDSYLGLRLAEASRVGNEKRVTSLWQARKKPSW